jgi:hypothetical protein
MKNLLANEDHVERKTNGSWIPAHSDERNDFGAGIGDVNAERLSPGCESHQESMKTLRRSGGPLAAVTTSNHLDG